MIKPEIIGYLHLNNIFHGKGNLEAMGKKLFGKEFLGFIKETTYVHSEGFLTKKLEPIRGTPAEEFRKAIEKAGLIGMNFMDPIRKPKLRGKKEVKNGKGI